MHNNKKKYRNIKSRRNKSGGAPHKYINLTILSNPYNDNPTTDSMKLKVTSHIKNYSIKDILFHQPHLKRYRDLIITSNTLPQEVCLIQIKDPKSTKCIEAEDDLINKPLETLELTDSRPHDLYTICTIKGILLCKVLSGVALPPILYTNFDDNLTFREVISRCQYSGFDPNSIKIIIKKDGKTVFPKILEHGYTRKQLEAANTSITPTSYNASSIIDDILQDEAFYTMKEYNGNPIKHISIEIGFYHGFDLPTEISPDSIARAKERVATMYPETDTPPSLPAGKNKKTQKKTPNLNKKSKKNK